jgi:hypothetical protein
LRPSDADLRLSLEDSLRRDAKIEVVGERLLNEMAQGGILKYCRPLLVGKRRRRGGRRDVGSESLTIGSGDISDGPLVVRTHLAADHEKHNDGEQGGVDDLPNAFYDQRCRHTKTALP